MSLARRPKLLLTGATGFVGSGVLRRLGSDGRHDVVAALRRRTQLAAPVSQQQLVGDFTATTDWSQALTSVELVIHSAARVHVMSGDPGEGDASFNAVNVLATLNLARQAAASGVRRFVFLSSVKVNGESTEAGRPFTAADVPAPADAYGISKRDAEARLLELCARSDMQCTIIRPPLVYGPGVGANFRTLIRWIQRGIPLPLGSVSNLRSFVALGNLVDLVVVCLEHPAAANQVFMVSDGEDISTSELVRRIARALGRPARLFNFPPALLRQCAAVLGKADVAARLCDSLQVDITRTRELLQWHPPVRLDEGLQATVEEFRAEAAL